MSELWSERLGTQLGPEPSQSSDRRSKGPCPVRGLRAPWRDCWFRSPDAGGIRGWECLMRLQRGGGLGQGQSPPEGSRRPDMGQMTEEPQ